MLKPATFSLVVFLTLTVGLTILSGQNIESLIHDFKNDIRGPYKDIRWFCPDGSVIPPKEQCKDTGGYQRARYKDAVTELALKKDIYLGQILMGTDKLKFYNKNNNYTQAKQYILEKYLQQIDDGWILQKAKYYRGSVQSEDESKWGKEFLKFILSKEQYNKEQYYLIRELSKYIPHGEETQTLSKIRSLSLTISNRQTSFMDLRTKIHGNLEVRDTSTIFKYFKDNAHKLGQVDLKEGQELMHHLRVFYKNDHTKLFKDYAATLKAFTEINSLLTKLSNDFNVMSPQAFCQVSIDLLSDIRTEIDHSKKSDVKLDLMDLSVKLEEIVLSKLTEWKSESLSELLEKSCYLGQMSYATGYLYKWEYDELLSVYSITPEENSSFKYLYDFYKTIKKNINWASSIIVCDFGEEVERWEEFESLSSSFIDDRIRSSAILHLGKEATALNDYLVNKANWNSNFFGSKSAEVQGVNPGFAKGILKFASPSEHTYNPSFIYVFKKPPADLDPVAGILSLSEGNVVSHLQLLAKNLGIPNINITESAYSKLKTFEGEEIFLAASEKGGVVIKKAQQMNAAEQALFSKNTIDENVIRVPVEQMNLDINKVLYLNEIDAEDSGILCGPKAANFARLKKMFPNQLVDGFVIPFAVFKDHMLQVIPGSDLTYWDFLTLSFKEINLLKENGHDQKFIDSITIGKLTELSTLIKKMPLKQQLISQLENGFKEVLNADMGDLPVFLRSDTNMEDLKDFTGAGLNKTLFNVKEKNLILEGIREVWASPYLERSYKWRQKFLTNPEDVYPSILIIPSVFVDFSGVIITKDFIDNDPHSINVAFSQGVGGAVDGQNAETRVLTTNGRNVLFNPARDRKYKHILDTGKSIQRDAILSEPILNHNHLKQIWEVVFKVNDEMPKVGMEWPYDIELGFKDDKLWLFQIRPFVENKKAKSSLYLEKLNPKIPKNLIIDLKESIHYN